MGIYDRYILPRAINLACGTSVIMDMRAQVVPRARGRVLEVGMGSGINLPLYRSEQVEWVWGLEPSEGMHALAQSRVKAAPFPVHWLTAPAEKIPLEDNSVDTVLLTFTLCTIPDWKAALREMHRVLKPDGQLLFCEHGLAPEPGVQAWQQRINPLWKKCAGGCNINRPMAALIRDGGFTISELHEDYMPQTPRIAGYVAWGVAVKSVTD